MDKEQDAKPLPDKEEELEKLLPKSDGMTDATFKTAYLFLVERVATDIEAVHTNINKDWKPKVRLFVLWTNILRRFGANSELIRGNEQEVYTSLQHDESESFDNWVEKVKNKMHARERLR